MRSRLVGVTVGALVAISLCGAGSASAAEFGDGCVGNNALSGEPVTLFQIASPESPLPTAAPISGVITKWTVNLITGPTVPTFAQTLKIVRANTSTHSAQVIAEETKTISPGLNTFSSRIPVQAGDRLGLFGVGGSAVGTLYCAPSGSSNPANIVGAAEGSIASGSTAAFTEVPTLRLPVTATVEPDVDHDGYGDETQDKCPQSAATQLACPTITLDSLSLTGRNKATVYVTASTETPVSVTGTVKLAKGKTAQLSGGTQTVAPGKLVAFTLKFSKPIVKQLKEMPKSKKLTLSVTASATNVAGQVSTDTTTAKLKGQG